MTGAELMSVLADNMPVISGVVGPTVGSIVSAVLGAVFYRGKIDDEVLEKFKAGQFEKITEELLQNGKMTYSELYKMNNFMQIAKKADEFFPKLSRKKLDDDRKNDFDWYMRFYEAAGNISDEEMQLLWAKILEGEINEPGTFSLRSVECLRNLRKKDLLLFSKAYKASVFHNSKAFVPNYGEYLHKCQLSCEDILKLDELGLIFNATALEYQVNVSNTYPCPIIAGNYMLIVNGITEHDTTFTMQVFPFTTIGKELSSLIANDDPQAKDLLISLSKVLNQDRNLKMSLHRVNCVGLNGINYEAADLMASENL